MLRGITFSLSNLAEWTPTTVTGCPAYLRSSAASSGSTCMQLMQQYVLWMGKAKA